MLIDELIEKAFSDGYEYALIEQREFAFNPQQANGISKKAKKLARQKYWRSIGKQTVPPREIANNANVLNISQAAAETLAGRMAQNEVLKKSPKVTVHDRIEWRTSDSPLVRSLADPMQSRGIVLNGKRIDYQSAQRYRDMGLF